MIVYVESNFVLEIALQQEQHDACKRLIAIADESRIEICIPSFSMAEPYHTLVRRAKNRQLLAKSLDIELKQLQRSDNLTGEVEALRSVTGLLVRSEELEATGLKGTLDQLLSNSNLIALSAGVLRRSWDLEVNHGLTAPDAVVLSSVLCDLDERSPNEAVFLNRNSRDFDDPEIMKLLEDRRCRFLPSFQGGLHYVQSKISSQ